MPPHQPQPEGGFHHRVNSPDNASVLLVDFDNGAQAVGLDALKAVLLTLRRDDGEVPPPLGPDERVLAFTHEDGSFDTGSRAIRNMARVAVGVKPKMYRKTYRPIDLG